MENASAQTIDVVAIPRPQDPLADRGDPRRDIRGGLLIGGLFFVGFLGWAAFTPLDAAAVGEGQVTVSGQRQSVQHRDGGVVGAIAVHEGQKVRAGDILIRLAAPEVEAEAHALSSQAIALEAQRARLRTEQLGLGRIIRPAEFAGLTGRELQDANQAMAIQEAQLRTRSSMIAVQRGVVGSQGSQIIEQRAGYSRQLAAIIEQERLITEELDSLKEVADKGFVSLTRVRALQRAQADLVGQRGRLQASLSEASESSGESRLKGIEIERGQQEKIASELRDVELTLSDVLPKMAAARDRLARTEIRAPATGTVIGLSVFTVGGVVAPGQKLMELVPDKTPLVVEARFMPNDIDDIRARQEATVVFSGLRNRGLPRLHGTITRVSPDAFTDEKSGASYFTSEIVVPTDQIDILRSQLGSDFALKPGMPVNVQVTLRKRTALQYMLEPLSDTFSRSGAEH